MEETTANNNTNRQQNGNAYATFNGNGMECSLDDADNNPTPEYLQRKLYFLLEHLKKMHSELPE